MITHPDLDRFGEGKVKEVLEYLIEFSQKNEWEMPAIVPYEYNFTTGACVQWGSKIILYVLYEYQGIWTIEVDYLGVIKEFNHPSQISELIMFLLNK